MRISCKDLGCQEQEDCIKFRQKYKENYSGIKGLFPELEDTFPVMYSKNGYCELVHCLGNPLRECKTLKDAEFKKFIDTMQVTHVLARD